ncbi:MAG: extracellular solute-binding protein [Pseudomonadota bacterium]
MHGKPQLDSEFEHFPYVNREAPKGGKLVMGEVGGFDSLNGYILKGRAPWQVRALMGESLLARNWDEPFALYGLLAESVETPADRSWVAFSLRQNARFSDGSPVTVEDVIWSMETLGTSGHPRYRNAWASVEKIEATGPSRVRIDFSEPNRELPLIMGLRPILKRDQWQDSDFVNSDSVLAVGSGPYILTDHEAGRFLEFQRNPDWWGAELPVNRGLYNFDKVRIEYFRNDDAYWEAVKTGAISLHADYDPVRWEEGYDIPSVREGKLLRDELTHQRPTGLRGFVFNTRREVFADRDLRAALALSFDWEWINQRLYRGVYQRIESAFGNSPLGFDGPAGATERGILEGFDLPDGTLEDGWRPPKSDGSGRDRRALRAAGRLLDGAGWVIEDGRRMKNGQPLAFEILTSGTEQETLASLWSRQLERLGIAATVRRVDQAQYQQRRETYDYDMIVNRWGMSLSPGTEQRLYFHSSGRELEGTRNYMGVADPAVDAAIDALLAAEGTEDFQSAVRALDRVLNAGIYVIPFGVLPTDRLAHTPDLHRPESQTLYGWWGWAAGPARWWAE